MGVQGCGKSLSAKAIAGHWNLPLARLDLSSVFGAPRPEEAMQGALRTAEAMAPCVLWIDEIEKGFEGSGEGPAARLLGGMVTWLQEKTKEVFVVATANRVSSLPPELPRKGRFDEIFFIDLPNFHERFEILKLHMKKRGRSPAAFSLEALAKKADHLTGSELEQIIISAMYAAFARDLELSDSDILRALKDTVPLFETFEEEIKELRDWARKRARPASTDRRKIDFFSDNV
jgi:SpoVK/Ycf46/Vps4 family AAA+-type ATPase